MFHILVADDDKNTRKYIRAVLEADGYTVTTAENGAEALRVLDRDYIGIYAIHVDEAFRRQHIARDIVATLLIEGRRCGAGKAYLQVVSDNEPAKALYRSIGFEKRYDYHFLVRDVE